MRLSTLLLAVVLASPCCVATAESAGTEIAVTKLAAIQPAAAAGAQAKPLRITASVYPITMLVEEIGGNRVAVTTIIPPGTDPHHFEISPSSMRAVYESDAIFMIGADFDSHIIGDGPPGTQIRVEFCESLSDSLIELGHTFNPHFWLDPVLAGIMGECIGLTLITTDYENHAYYEERMARFAVRMDSLHADVKERLEVSGFDTFVSFHPAWTYFARRYGLTEAGVVEKYPEHEPSAKWVAGLIREIQRQDVEVLIVERASDPGVVKSLAEDTGLEVLSLDPIGDPDTPGRGDYFGLIGYNLGLIERATRGN